MTDVQSCVLTKVGHAEIARILFFFNPKYFLVREGIFIDPPLSRTWLYKVIMSFFGKIRYLSYCVLLMIYIDLTNLSKFLIFISSVYALVKQLDERRQSITSCNQLFDDDAKALRRQLISKIDGLIFQPYVSIGRKSREILWRKGFYDVISLVKRNWASKSATKIQPDEMALQRTEMMQLIHEGITIYRSIVVRLDRYFDMDLRNILDFSVLIDDDASDETVDSGHLFPVDLLNYAVETVHAAMLSLGDLHRYFIDFNFDKPCLMRREQAARFYHDAFQLNTKIGMAQNQLGTLFTGQRYDLDAMYHYLHSLVCSIPFELSENNVAKIFAANAEYLKLMVEDGSGANVRDFLARFKLIADIFFYEKDVTDFNALCHCLLIDLRALLATKRSQLTSDFLFKVVGILMFCLTKLSASQSATVHSLNALLVAVCSEMVDSAIGHLEKFVASRAEQNGNFQDTYGTLFELFDRNVRLSRKSHRVQLDETKAKNGSVVNVKNGEKRMVVDNVAKVTKVAQRKSMTSESSLGSNRNLSDDKPSKADDRHEEKPRSEESRKKSGFKLRRRRRRLNSDNSDADNTDAGSESETTDDYHMDSDFSSVEDSSEADSSDEEAEEQPSDEDQLEVTLKPENNSNGEDMIVEEERLIYMNGMSHPTDEGPNDGTLDRILMMLCHISDEDAKLNSELIGSNLPMYSTENNAKNLGEPTTDVQSASEKLRYKRKYTKVDPNIIIEFAQQECTLQALKVLFDWLRINHELLINCFASNPEFVYKIMRFMNHLNVDVFTRKVCFDRSLIKIADLRPDLDRLFETRATIPLHEDLMLKDLAVLAAGQQQLDFESRMQLRLSGNEESALRMFKLVDFGFFVAKTKQFGFNFCARSRVFVLASGPKENGGRQKANRIYGDQAPLTRGMRAKRRKNEERARNRVFVAKPAMDNYATSTDENDVILLGKNEVPKVSYVCVRQIHVYKILAFLFSKTFLVKYSIYFITKVLVVSVGVSPT